MAMDQVTQVCPSCGGTGSHTGTSTSPGGPVPYDNPCTKCDGVGSLPHSNLPSDLIDFISDMKDNIDDIKEKVDEIKEVVDAL
jgi:hypothetical protein